MRLRHLGKNVSQRPGPSARWRFITVQQLDPDLVIEEMEKCFGPKGAWADLLSDAFWEFEHKSFSDYAENAEALWSEAGR
jgi:hypothetical protein